MVDLDRVRNRRGASVFEIILASAIFVILLFSIVRLLPGLFDMIRRYTARQEMTRESRTYLDTAARFLERAIPRSVRICACAADACSPACPEAATMPPNSRIEFALRDGTPYAIYLSTNPPNTAILRVTRSTGAITALASNVSAIAFTGDIRDPAVVYITLWMDAAADRSGRADRVYTVYIPNRLVRMSYPE
jgi:hypothetical protein